MINSVDDKNGDLKKHFIQMAQEIVSLYHPKTVLDTICVKGYLVEALRDLGVEAYGLASSEYAFSKVQTEIQPFCKIGSITKPMPASIPSHYDVVVNLEGLKHLTQQEKEKAIKNLCQWGENIILSSPEKEADSIVQPLENWPSFFEKEGFFCSVGETDFTDPGVLLFCRQNSVSLSYLDEKELLKKQLEMAEKKYEELDKRYQNKVYKLEALEEKWIDLQKSYWEITSSFYWRMTKPLRLLGTGIKKLIFMLPPIVWFLLFLKEFRSLGLKPAAIRAWHRMIGQAWKDDPEIDLSFTMPKNMRRAQVHTKFLTPFSFDIFVWLDDTPINQIEALIHSVKKQTYQNWKLHLIIPASNAAYEELERRETQENRLVWIKTDTKSPTVGLNNALAGARGQFKMFMKASDLLHPAALFECQSTLEKNGWDMLYTDTAYFSSSPSEPWDYHFKPDYSPVTLRGHNYIGDLLIFSESLVNRIGALSEKLDEKSHYDWVLRLTEQGAKIGHIAKALYYAREEVENTPKITPKQNERMKVALKEHLKRCDLDAQVIPLEKNGAFRVQYQLKQEPLVSILIPNKDYIYDLSTCINSIMEQSTYRNFEIIIIENNSTDPQTFAYYEEIQKEYANIKVVYWEGIFNYSAINNFGASFAKGEYLLLLNNDVEVITPNWLEELLGFAQQEKVGAVGAMLYYPDDTVQHAGVTVGVLGVGGHAHKDFTRGSEGYHNRLLVAQNVSCVTAACMLLVKKVFDQVGGLNEDFEVAFNDVDLCMKILAAQYDIIFTPFAELYHFESKSRGTDDAPEKQKRFLGEVALFLERWDGFLQKGDPYYNPNLTLAANDFSLKYDKEV